MKGFIKVIGAVGLAGSLLLMGGCGDDSTPAQRANVPATPVAVTNGVAQGSSLTASTKSGTTLATVTIPAGTALTVNGVPVTGTSVTAEATVSQSESALPAAARQSLPSNKNLAAFIDLTITGDNNQVVNGFNPAITVNLVTDYAAGTTLTIYSYNSTTGAWTSVGQAVVKADGSVDISVSHLSIWGVFKSATTGTGTGTGGNGTAGGQ